MTFSAWASSPFHSTMILFFSFNSLLLTKIVRDFTFSLSTVILLPFSTLAMTFPAVLFKLVDAHPVLTAMIGVQGMVFDFGRLEDPAFLVSH